MGVSLNQTNKKQQQIMANEVANTTNNVPVQTTNPFDAQRSEHLNIGTVEIEMRRAMEEVRAKILIAKNFPRNEAEARAKIIESCRNPKIAYSALYSYPRGYEIVVGISIRLAEEMARLWGNLEYGIRELSNENGVAEMEAYCWDMQTNVTARKTFKLPLERHTKEGITKLTNPRDQYEHSANYGARRLRGMILSVLPSDLVEAAEDKISDTLASNPMLDALLESFKQYGVSQKHIEAKLGKKLAEMKKQDWKIARGIYNAIKDKQAHPSDFFAGIAKPTRTDDGANALNAALNAPKKPS